jgi:flagellar biosynthesis chaperone FliJ
MAQPFSLQPLLEIMQNRTDEATRKLGQLIAAEQSAKSRLQMLEQYRDEYAQKLREATAQGITQLALRNYQEFMARIDEAIMQQSIAVKNSAQQPAKRTGKNKTNGSKPSTRCLNVTTHANVIARANRNKSYSTNSLPATTP